eukprot:TRINITY_DN11410_c0_g1_i1.p1 TRINITY_DN11410_c0_g1~~TRINITY_DN11410_c0_g1_i1.p1  ORF type:complete len:301 (+),score=48.54 TRINITY_DN11410_c0_g1_i1:6-908(+)
MYALGYPQTDSTIKDHIKTQTLWITYRRGFQPVHPSVLTTDAGWGCMIRTAQMMLSTALFRYFRTLHQDIEIEQLRMMVTDMFRDYEQSPFSIQKIVREGTIQGKSIGSWFGPTSICICLKQIMEDLSNIRLQIYSAVDSMICLDELNNQSFFEPMVLLVPVRLGLHGINALYIPSLVKYMQLKQSIGFIGGKPNYSYYFVGVKDFELLYLDPHTTQDLEDDGTTTYWATETHTMPCLELDESLALGFYIANREDWNNFEANISQMDPSTSLFSIHSSRVMEAYNAVNDIGDDWNMDDFL